VRAPRQPKVWSVAEVNRSVREMLEDYLPPLGVSGEVGNWTAHRSGHRYFTLKDDQAQIRCVMCRIEARRLPLDPDNGMNV
jgi:exodeoxyribonuclease VII large subunit